MDSPDGNRFAHSGTPGRNWRMWRSDGGGLRLSYGDLDGNKEKTYQIGNLIYAEINKKFTNAIWNGDQEKKIFIPKFKWRKKTEIVIRGRRPTSEKD